MSRKGQSDDLQPPSNPAQMDSAMSCIESNNPLSSHVPGQPLRMIFKRLYNDNWSSRLVTALLSQTAEKTSLPDTRPPSPEMSECHGCHVPLSVLYEDLQVSSSSEESDLEWDTSWKGRLTSSVSDFEGIARLSRGVQGTVSFCLITSPCVEPVQRLLLRDIWEQTHRHWVYRWCILKI
jgi:hypothetical protein